MHLPFTIIERQPKKKVQSLRECTKQIGSAIEDFRDFVHKMTEEAKQESQKNGSWLKKANGSRK